jgi:hypothetical protein
MKAGYFIFSLFFGTNCFSQGKFFGGNGDGFASAQITNVVLPLQVINFFGKANSNSYIVYWSTVSEENILYFEIERSDDGIVFEKIGEVAGAGNSNGLKQYQFTDKKLTGQQYYYRLKQIDIDGRYSFSNIILLKNNGSKQDVVVSPNPVVNKVAILFQTEMINEEFLVMNSSGQVVSKFIINGRTGSVDLSGRPAGLYLLTNQKLRIAVKIQKLAE